MGGGEDNANVRLCLETLQDGKSIRKETFVGRI